MLPDFFLLVAGLVTLVFGADVMVRGASRLAVSMGISPLVVGLTVVAFGTSAPELAVSVGASFNGNPSLAVGNIIGSNIANVLLILGISAIIAPLLVAEQIIRQEVPIMVGAVVLMVVMSLDGAVTRFEAITLFALVVGYTMFLIRQSRRASRETEQEFESEIPKTQWDRHWSVQLALVVVGVTMLVLGANWLVDAASSIARTFGVSDLVIGLTVVAVGTSMPEVATSVVAAMRGQRDIAVGNVVGSNVFNVFAVLGLTGIVAPDGIPVPEAARQFDLWVMLAVTLACLPILVTGREISRLEGGAFLGYYAAYLAWLVLEAQGSSVLPAFASLMTSIVMPATVILIILSIVRHNNRALPLRR